MVNLDKNFKKLVLVIIRDLFMATFALFVLFSFLEILKPKIILNYLNLDVYFFVMLFFGIITIFYYEPEKKEQEKISFWAKSALILFSILIGIFFFYLTRAIGWLSILVGMASAIMCYFFIYINNQKN